MSPTFDPMTETEREAELTTEECLDRRPTPEPIEGTLVTSRRNATSEGPRNGGRRGSAGGWLTGTSIAMSPDMLTILIVLLIIAAIGSAPAWPHSRGWGFYPSGGLGLLVLVLVILAVTGQLHI